MNSPTTSFTESRPQNMIFMLGDGYGPAEQTVCRTLRSFPGWWGEPVQSLALDPILVGTIRTRSNSR